jgi:hypothetical protein
MNIYGHVLAKADKEAAIKLLTLKTGKKHKNPNDFNVARVLFITLTLCTITV